MLDHAGHAFHEKVHAQRLIVGATSIVEFFEMLVECIEFLVASMRIPIEFQGAVDLRDDIVSILWTRTKNRLTFPLRRVTYSAEEC